MVCLVRASPKNILNSGLGILRICPDTVSHCLYDTDMSSYLQFLWLLLFQLVLVGNSEPKDINKYEKFELALPKRTQQVSQEKNAKVFKVFFGG